MVIFLLLLLLLLLLPLLLTLMTPLLLLLLLLLLLFWLINWYRSICFVRFELQVNRQPNNYITLFFNSFLILCCLSFMFYLLFSLHSIIIDDNDNFWLLHLFIVVFGICSTYGCCWCYCYIYSDHQACCCIILNTSQASYYCVVSNTTYILILY